jgi:DMSO/TMAO reductase YedYZ molybdopterin-dependent catalytic subunit
MKASIPVEKALSPWGDVVLAYEMNGAAIPRDHGYPVRAVVPGHVGVRNVKWVERVEVRATEAEGPWQRGIAYKGFAPGRAGAIFARCVIGTLFQPFSNVHGRSIYCPLRHRHALSTLVS